MVDQEPAIGQSIRPSAQAGVEPEIGGTLGAPTKDPGDSTSWLGHLWNIAKTAGGDVADTAKDAIKTAAQSGGDPIKFLTDMGVKAGKAQLDQLKQSYDLAKEHRYVEAYGHGVAGITPVVGPVLAHVAEDVGTGDPAKFDEAVGHVLSTGAMTAAPELAGDALPAVKAAMDARTAAKVPPGSTRLFTDIVRAVPPTKTAAYTVTDVQRATPYLASEHASAPIATVEGLRDATDSAITQIEEHVKGYVDRYATDPIRTKPMDAARAALQTSVRSGDLEAGLKELSDLGLDGPITLQRADAIRLRLNAENQAVLKRNNYDVAIARKVDPTFAAREAAVAALRDGIYDQLEQRGISGVADLRRDEGSLIKLRSAAQGKIYNGDRTVAGSGTNSLTAKLVRGGIAGAGAAGGAAAAGPLGAAAGVTLANDLVTRYLPPNLTRDALIERGFSNIPQTQAPAFPQMPPTLTDPQRLLSSGAIQLPPKPDVSGSGGLMPARGIVVRDPKTGRFKRVYTGEVKGGGS